MQKIEIIKPIDYPGWDDLVLSTPDYSFFHSSSWARVLVESYDYKPLYFTILDKGRLLALIPVMEINSPLTGRRGVSLPFSDYCEPVILESANFHDVFNHIAVYGKKAGWKYIELRGGTKLFQHISLSSYFYGHTLDLKQNEDKIFSGFRSTTRKNIKKALREGVTAKVCNSLDSIREYYRLNCLTRKSHGLPPQPFHFFRIVFDHIISRNEGTLVLASYHNKVVAGAVFLHFGDRVIYKYGASDRTYQNVRPNNLVMWEAIKSYLLNGYKNFSFGRTEIENPGLLKFKDGWTNEVQIINYYRYDLIKGSMLQEKARYFNFYRSILGKCQPIS